LSSNYLKIPKTTGSSGKLDKLSCSNIMKLRTYGKRDFDNQIPLKNPKPPVLTLAVFGYFHKK